MKSTYLEPSWEAGRALVRRGIGGELVMLNLLRFREIADYSASPELAAALSDSRLLPLVELPR